MKVLIVDDERLERVLIANAVDWEKYGLEIIGEAGNGEEALEFFDINEPDLILTDINMPFMDGVVFAENVRKRSKTCRIIMLTGYREFEYARKAVFLGVDDFLVKPINAAELQRAVLSSKERMESERGQKEELKHLKKEALDNHKLLRDAFLQRLLERHIGKEEALHKLQMFQLTDLMKQCVCANLRIRLAEDCENKKEYNDKIFKWVEEHTTAKVCFMHYLENLILFYAKEDTLEVERQIRALLNYAVTIPQLRIQAGISHTMEGFEGISEAYGQTLKVISAGFIFGQDRYLHYADYEKISSRTKADERINWKELDMAIASGVPQRVESCIAYYVGLVLESKEQDADYLKIMTLEILSRAAGILAKHGKSLTKAVDERKYYEGVAKIETSADMEKFLNDTLQKVFHRLQEPKKKKGTAMVENVLKYVREHLTEQDLGLKRIATELYVNASYLSRVFKQEIGESLIEYITRNRIEKSMQLLNNTDMKAYEIAEAVGIKDAHYFSICFKKYVGMTVKEYKTQE